MCRILNLVGFRDLSDFLGVHITGESFRNILAVSAAIGAWLGYASSVIEDFSGISIMWFMFLVIGSVADIVLGLVANVWILHQPYESSKMIRGIFKALVVIVMILLINMFLQGAEQSATKYDWIHSFISYTAATLHYTVVTLASIFILLGISENGEKLGIGLFKSLNKIFRVKIKDIEETGLKKVDDETR